MHAHSRLICVHLLAPRLTAHRSHTRITSGGFSPSSHLAPLTPGPSDRQPTSSLTTASRSSSTTDTQSVYRPGARWVRRTPARSLPCRSSPACSASYSPALCARPRDATQPRGPRLSPTAGARPAGTHWPHATPPPTPAPAAPPPARSQGYAAHATPQSRHTQIQLAPLPAPLGPPRGIPPQPRRAAPPSAATTGSRPCATAGRMRRRTRCALGRQPGSRSPPWTLVAGRPGRRAAAPPARTPAPGAHGAAGSADAATAGTPAPAGGLGLGAGDGGGRRRRGKRRVAAAAAGRDGAPRAHPHRHACQTGLPLVQRLGGDRLQRLGVLVRRLVAAQMLGELGGRHAKCGPHLGELSAGAAWSEPRDGRPDAVHRASLSRRGGRRNRLGR
eukprot:scaffold14757_cov111-Isochrysis_galbana.AAC.4